MTKCWIYAVLLILGMQGHIVAATDELERSLQFKVYTWYDELSSRDEQIEVPELYYKVSSERYQLIELKRSQVSLECKTVLSDSLTLYKKQLNDEGEEIYVPSVTQKIMRETKQAFVYLFPFEGKLVMMVIDTGLEAIPNSSMLFINRSQSLVEVDLNGNKVVVKSLEQKIVPYAMNAKSTLRLQVREDGRKRPLSVMTVGARENQRLIGLFYPVRKGRYRVLLEREIDDQSVKVTPKGSFSSEH